MSGFAALPVPFGARQGTTINLYASGGSPGNGFIDGNFHDHPDLQLATIQPGTYEVDVVLFMSMGNGDAGLKWQLAGSATYDGSTRFRRDLSYNNPVTSVAATGFKSGESVVPTGFGSTTYLMAYQGTIVVTAAGTFIVQIGTPSAADSGQLLADSWLSLKKMA